MDNAVIVAGKIEVDSIEIEMGSKNLLLSFNIIPNERFKHQYDAGKSEHFAMSHKEGMKLAQTLLERLDQIHYGPEE